MSFKLVEASSAAIWVRSAPSPSDMVTTMAAVPSTTPNMVNTLLSLRRSRLDRLVRRISIHFIVFHSLSVAAARVNAKGGHQQHHDQPHARIQPPGQKAHHGQRGHLGLGG